VITYSKMGEPKSLSRPPIDEVVCGVIFEPMEKWTPAEHGRYWASRSDDFPKHEVHPPIEDVIGEMYVGMPTVRTWLVDKDETRLVQLQHDRFFVNWRRRSETDPYPRFKAQEGKAGFIEYVLKEYAAFREFARSRDCDVSPKFLELTKIDLLVQGRHWEDARSLSRLLPVLGPMIESLEFDGTTEFLWRTGRKVGDCNVLIGLVTVRQRATGNPGIKLEIRTRKQITRDDDIGKSWLSLNELNNEQFFNMLAEAELGRFE
jgi:uncharacterized protein (TIGR04255 family)